MKSTGPSEGRKIIHVDMDAFFASVEQRDDPRLRGIPLAVGGSDARGVVAAASYEARQFGVRSAMPKFKARELCPHLTFVPPRFEVYRAISKQTREIFAEYAPLVEPMSLDEAYLDVTENPKGIPYAWQVAKEVRGRILEATGLTASAGVSYNKFLAKMASGQRKPDGQFAITPEQGADFVAALPIGKFHGIGPATAAKMEALGILTGADLRERDLTFLARHFGKSGLFFHDIARGMDSRPVNPERIRKSVGAENTFSRDLTDMAELRAELEPLVAKVWSHCEANGTRGRTVTLKATFSDFRQITRSKSARDPYPDAMAIRQTAREILASLAPLEDGVRLVGVTLSSLESTSVDRRDGQMALFD